MKLINRQGRTEAMVEGNAYLTIEGQYSDNPGKHYITADGRIVGDITPGPPSQYTIELPDTVDGNRMYASDMTLGDERVYAPVLDNGRYMFQGSSITSFDGDLPAMTDGNHMFAYCDRLTSFSGDLSALTTGFYMFDGCSSLTSFSIDLPALTDGSAMFTYCRNLASFSGDLSALTDGDGMFENCKLDLESVQHIVNSVPSHTSGSHYITIGVDSSQVTQEQQDEANATIVTKGWTVYWQRN